MPNTFSTSKNNVHGDLMLLNPWVMSSEKRKSCCDPFGIQTETLVYHQYSPQTFANVQVLQLQPQLFYQFMTEDIGRFSLGFAEGHFKVGKHRTTAVFHSFCKCI
jgi:hypothetical protein